MNRNQTPVRERIGVRINGKRYHLATAMEVRAGGLRAWSTQQKPGQQSNGERFSIQFRDWSQGAGFSYDGLQGTYAWARGFDASAPGRLVTYPQYATLQSFTSVDSRGWQFRLGAYLYVCRGRWVVKYAIQETNYWPIIEKHDLASGTGTNASNVIAGRPEVFGGKAYVPVRVGVSGALTRFQELTTQATTVVEVQTITISGTPTGGTYIITWDGKSTAAIAYNAVQATVQAALRLIPGLELVTVVTTGSTPNFTHTVTMTGAGGSFASSPSAMTYTDNTTGGTHGIAIATPTPGTVDTWTLSPATAMARSFRRYGSKLQKTQGNGTAPADNHRVYAVEADPMTIGDWAPAVGTGYVFGDSNHEAVDMADYGGILAVGKTDGPYSLDPSFQALSLIPDFVNNSDNENCIGMETGLGMLLIPTVAGLIAWDGSGYVAIGPGQERGLNARVDHGGGRITSLAVSGNHVYFTSNDSYRDEGVFGVFYPPASAYSYPRGAQVRDMVWHELEIESGRYENVILLPSNTDPVQAHYPTIWTGTTGSGTVNWTSSSNAGADDTSYATAGGTGITTHELMGVSPQPGVPTDATVVGVQVEIVRKMKD